MLAWRQDFISFNVVTTLSQNLRFQSRVDMAWERIVDFFACGRIYSNLERLDSCQREFRRQNGIVDIAQLSCVVSWVQRSFRIRHKTPGTCHFICFLS